MKSTVTKDIRVVLISSSGLERDRFERLRHPARPRGALRARSHSRFVPPLIHFIPLTYSVPLFLKRHCDQPLGALLDLLLHMAEGGLRERRRGGDPGSAGRGFFYSRGQGGNPGVKGKTQGSRGFFDPLGSRAQPPLGDCCTDFPHRIAI
jgi:hypothetical protein